MVLRPVCNKFKEGKGLTESELFLKSILLYKSILNEQNTIRESNSAIDKIDSNELFSYNDEKIGILVRREFQNLIDEHIITNEVIERLLDSKFSKEVFGLTYPMLRKVDETRPLLEQRQVNGYSRYYSKTYKTNGKRYLLCNNWLETSRSKFLLWVKSRRES